MAIADNKKNGLGESWGIHGRAGAGLVAAAAAILLLDLGTVLWFLLPRLGKLDFLRLHYSAELGVDWIAEWWKIFIYPAAGLMVFFSNAVFSGILARRHRLFGTVVWAATVVIELMLAAAAFLTVRLNG